MCRIHIPILRFLFFACVVCTPAITAAAVTLTVRLSSLVRPGAVVESGLAIPVDNRLRITPGRPNDLIVEFDNGLYLKPMVDDIDVRPLLLSLPLTGQHDGVSAAGTEIAVSTFDCMGNIPLVWPPMFGRVGVGFDGHPNTFDVSFESSGTPHSIGDRIRGALFESYFNEPPAELISSSGPLFQFFFSDGSFEVGVCPVPTIFDFDDGTNQDWRHAGFYDDSGLVPIAGHFWESPAWWTDRYGAAIGVGSSTGRMHPASPSGNTWIHEDLISPNLAGTPQWQGITEFTYDVTGEHIALNSDIFVQTFIDIQTPDLTEIRITDRISHRIFDSTSAAPTPWTTFTVDVAKTFSDGGIPPTSTIREISIRFFFEAGPRIGQDGWVLVDNVTPMTLGDIDRDGTVDGLDINPFVALVTEGVFQREGDVNRDGAVNGLDVSGFVDLVVSGGGAVVPEPSTILLSGLSAMGLLCWRRKRR